MSDDRPETPAEPQGVPIVTSLADYPLLPRCCEHAAEQGYRRGYRDGYWYALWDVGKCLRFPPALWQQFERFFNEALTCWAWRAKQDEDADVWQECAPRFRKASVRQKKGA